VSIRGSGPKIAEKHTDMRDFSIFLLVIAPPVRYNPRFSSGSPCADKYLKNEKTMFDALTDKLNSVVRSLSGRGRITEANVTDAMREVRKALLEADVNYQVTKQFCKDVKEAALGAEVIKSLRPGEVLIKVVNAMN
jgi:signal recognition particle GTPase